MHLGTCIDAKIIHAQTATRDVLRLRGNHHSPTTTAKTARQEKSQMQGEQWRAGIESRINAVSERGHPHRSSWRIAAAGIQRLRAICSR